MIVKWLKSEAAKTLCGVVVIIAVFVLSYITVNQSADMVETDHNVYSDITYLPGFPYHLPLLDIPIAEDFSPWARRTGLQAPPDTFMHHLEFRIDQETNTVHTKLGVTSPRYVPLEQVVITLGGVTTVWPHINQEVMALNDGETYFRFHTSIEMFRRNDADLIQWHLTESDTETSSGELLIFEARIER